MHGWRPRSLSSHPPWFLHGSAVGRLLTELEAPIASKTTSAPLRFLPEDDAWWPRMDVHNPSLTFCIPFWLSNGASLSPRLTRLNWGEWWGSKDGLVRVFWMIKWICHPVCFYPKLEIQHSLHDFCPFLYPSSATHTQITSFSSMPCYPEENKQKIISL